MKYYSNLICSVNIQTKQHMAKQCTPKDDEREKQAGGRQEFQEWWRAGTPGTTFCLSKSRSSLASPEKSIVSSSLSLS